MAKIKLSEGGFSLIPEGVTVFKVMKVDDSKYEKFGKVVVTLQTAAGQTHNETYSFLTKTGEVNEGAVKAWSYFARVCLNNFSAEEIDTQDVVGCYIQARVEHETFTRTKGTRAGEEGTSVRLKDYAVASGFKSGTKKSADPEPEESDDGDDDLDDLDDFLDS
jgi:hypothetical protein